MGRGEYYADGRLLMDSPEGLCPCYFIIIRLLLRHHHDDRQSSSSCVNTLSPLSQPSLFQIVGARRGEAHALLLIHDH